MNRKVADPMRTILATCLLVLALPARAEVLCPDSLDVRQEASIAGDWTVSYTEPPLRLTGVNIFDGPPSQNRRIKPYSVKTTKGELQVSWRLPQSKRNFHLTCSYERTTASLATLLPPGVNGCNAVFDRRVSYGNETLAVKRMVCN
ncbi:MAG TPA: STY0301 family protein [Burkholderiales bacterium]|nr:STY0301 family protein [Burkholderiales bacterium]